MDQFIDIDGIRTRYRRVGDGPDVLVLHGWGARIEAVGPILDGSRAHCTVYAPSTSPGSARPRCRRSSPGGSPTTRPGRAR